MYRGGVSAVEEEEGGGGGPLGGLGVRSKDCRMWQYRKIGIKKKNQFFPSKICIVVLF